MSQTYGDTWQTQTQQAQESLPQATIRDFYLSSAFIGLYDKPSPFPDFTDRPLGVRRTLRQVLTDWYRIFRNVRRFRMQFRWMRGCPAFPSVVPFLPSAEHGITWRTLVPFFVVYEGKKVNGPFIKGAEQLLRLDQAVPKEAFNIVCEIGGGFGSMAEMVIKKYTPARYIIIDIPETMRVSELYLNFVFPGCVHRHVPGMPIPSLPGKTTIVLIDESMAEQLTDIAPGVGLFINGNSFAEMPYEYVQRYFKIIESFPGIYLSNTNRTRDEGGHLYAGPESYPYTPGRWEFLLEKHQELNYYRSNCQMIAKLAS